jgi:hypothetical protein
MDEEAEEKRKKQKSPPSEAYIFNLNSHFFFFRLRAKSQMSVQSPFCPKPLTFNADFLQERNLLGHAGME